LDDVVMRGLSRNVEDRFSTALEMARALRSVSGTLLPFEVAEWLEQMTPDALARQASRVAELERLVMPRPTWSKSERPAPTPSPLLDAADAAPQSTRTNMALTPRRTNRAPGPSARASAWLARRPRARPAAVTTIVALMGFSSGILLVEAIRPAIAPAAPRAGMALPSTVRATATASVLAVDDEPTALVPAPPPSVSSSAEAPRKLKRAPVVAAPSTPAPKRVAKIDDGF
jgi:hypothetical protein